MFCRKDCLAFVDGVVRFNFGYTIFFVCAGAENSEKSNVAYPLQDGMGGNNRTANQKSYVCQSYHRRMCLASSGRTKSVSLISLSVARFLILRRILFRRDADSLIRSVRHRAKYCQEILWSTLGLSQHPTMLLLLTKHENVFRNTFQTIYHGCRLDIHAADGLRSFHVSKYSTTVLRSYSTHGLGESSGAYLIRLKSVDLPILAQ